MLGRRQIAPGVGIMGGDRFMAGGKRGASDVRRLGVDRHIVAGRMDPPGATVMGVAANMAGGKINHGAGRMGVAKDLAVVKH
jgi:hypothetical protein